MSEQTPEKEIEVVAGVIEGVTQKKPDTWQVAVKPDGSQYTKNLWSKDSELVGSLTAKLGQHGAFVCSASYWTNQSGQQVRSLWINSAGDEAPDLGELTQKLEKIVQTRSTPDTAAKADVDWDAKERRDYRSRAWAQTISALAHTIKVDESSGDIFRRLHGLQRMIYQDIVRDLDTEAFPDDDVPF